MAFKFLQTLGADDIFISYSREDGEPYLKGMQAALSARGFSCFSDRLGTDAGEKPPDSLYEKVRSCKTLVLLGTPGAIDSPENITPELDEFAKVNGTARIICVSFDRGTQFAPFPQSWHAYAVGKARVRETPAALTTGAPSPDILENVADASNYMKSKDRLRRYRNSALAVLGALAVAIVVAAVIAVFMFRVANAAKLEADAATTRAETEKALAAQATKDAQEAQKAARKAQEDADAARTEADKQKAEADRQKAEASKQKELAERAAEDARVQTKLAEEATRKAQDAAREAKAAQEEAATQKTVADARRLANHSQVLLRQRPENVEQSLDEAIDAMRMSHGKNMHVLEADTALRDTLAMLPRLRKSHPYPSGSVVALSPDGLYFATQSENKLSVYEYGSKAEPKVIDCACTLVALSGGGAYAAAQTEEGLKMFDLKGGKPPRVLKLGDGVVGDKFALSPDGRYLALYLREGEDVDTHSAVQIYDAASGGLVKSFDALDIFANDIAFGPTGNLAVAGRHTTQVNGKFAGRVALWTLNPSDDAAAPELKADSFPAPDLIPLDSEVKAVAPGGSATFAADRVVWARAAGRVRYRPVGLLGYSSEEKRNETKTAIKHMALSPDGGTLTLAREIKADGDSPADEGDALDVWDATGREEQSRVFHEKEVVSVGFKEDGLVATMTDTPTNAEPARVFQATDGKEVEKIVYGPTGGDGDVKYVSGGDGRVVSAGGGVATVWDVWGRKKQAAAFGDALQNVEAATLSPGGKFLALAGKGVGEGGWLFVIYSSDGVAYKEWKRFANPSEPVEMMSLSEDGSRLATLHHYDTSYVRVWDTNTGGSVTPDALHFQREVETENFAAIPDMRLIALSPRGGFLMTTDRKRNRTWLLDLSKGRAAELTELPSLDGATVTSAAFSRDDRYLGLGADDLYLHVFDTRGREGVTEIALLQHTGKVTAVAFSDKLKYVATASSDPHSYRVHEEQSYPVRVWLLQPPDLIEEAERRQQLDEAKPGQQ